MAPSHLLSFRHWRLLSESAAAQLVAYDTRDVPIGPNVSDGAVIITPAPGTGIEKILLDGIEIGQPLQQSLLDRLTKFSKSDWGDWLIFAKAGASFELQIYPIGSQQPVLLPVKMTSKGVSAHYLAQPGWQPLALKAKLLPTPEQPNLPAGHEKQLERATAEGGCCLVVKSARPFSRVESNSENLKKGENWLESEGLHWFYPTATSFSLRFDYMPTRFDLSFGQLMDANSFPRLKTGVTQWVEIS